MSSPMIFALLARMWRRYAQILTVEDNFIAHEKLPSARTSEDDHVVEGMIFPAST